MKKIFILCIVSLIIVFNGYCQKEVEPVLKPEIAGKYEGELRKGLANGEGTATGLETYKGHFIKGIPEGHGTYTFKNGNVYTGSFKNGIMDGKGTMTLNDAGMDSILTGYWEEGKYIGKVKIDPYEISNKSGSVQEHVTNVGDGNSVEISIVDPFNAYIGAQIFTEGRYVQKSYYGREYFEDVTFPITFSIKYTCSNKMRSGMIISTIRVKINKSGNWIIKLRN